MESCFVSRNAGNNVQRNSKALISGNILENVKNQNITNNNFFIKKAEIEVVTQNRKDKFICNLKFENPGKYLISIKSRSGIEGARIYISGDTILVNDRISKKLYFGTSFYLEKKYGLTQSCLPLIFGDVVFGKTDLDKKEQCSGEKLKINCIVKGIALIYDIDCKIKKAISVNMITSYVQPYILIKYGSFVNIENILIPRLVEFEDTQYNTKIKVRILKVELPWNGNVKFIPGKGYELIELV
jgi:hypothetical protein